MYQNRMSAQRSRDRQKCLEKTIKSRLELLQREHRQLQGQAQSLRHACRMARAWLQQHRNCLRHTDISPDPTPLPAPSAVLPLQSSSPVSLSNIASFPPFPLSVVQTSLALPLCALGAPSAPVLSAVRSSSSLALSSLKSSSGPGLLPLSVVECSSAVPLPCPLLPKGSGASRASGENQVR